MAGFKRDLQARFDSDPAVIYSDDPLPKITKGKTIVKMNDQRYKVEAELGQGNYATVYAIRCRSDATVAWALKLQQSEGWWDYYIHTEAIRRIRALPDSSLYLPHIIPVEQFQRMKGGGSCCFLPLFDQGTIVTLINTFQRSSSDKIIPEV